jgi:hypothetical protein
LEVSDMQIGGIVSLDQVEQQSGGDGWRRLNERKGD